MPTCTLSPVSGAPGDKITVVMAGFLPAFGTFNVIGWGKTLAAGQFDAKGGATTSFVIPSGTAAGPYQLTAVSTSALQTAQATITVKGAAQTPTMTLTPSTAQQGTDVSLKTSGWTPGAILSYAWSGIGTIYSDLKADSLGNFNQTIHIDQNRAPNSYVVSMWENANPSRLAKATLIVTAASPPPPPPPGTPSMTLTPISAEQNTDISLKSSGWTPGATLTYGWSGIGTIYNNLKADAQGNFNQIVHIDANRTPGAYTVSMFENANPARKASAGLTVKAATTGGGGGGVQDWAAALQKLILDNLTWVGVGAAAIVLILLILYFRKDIAKLAQGASRATQGAVKSAVRGR